MLCDGVDPLIDNHEVTPVIGWMPAVIYGFGAKLPTTRHETEIIPK